MKSRFIIQGRFGFNRFWLAALALGFIFAGPLSATNVGGRISTDTTWTLAGSPYIVTSNVSVYGTATQTAKLTIEAGVQVKFNGNYYIQIGYSTNKGALYAIGTSGNPIVFTSNMSAPARGNWNYIYFDGATDDALTQMSYCTVEYGGSGSSTGSIRLLNSAPTITDCTIRYSKYDGIRCQTSSPVIQGGSIVDNNTKGIYIVGSSTLTISGTSFSGNGSYAISADANCEIVSTSGITASSTDRVEIRAGSVRRDLTWRNLGIPFCITGNISVYKDATTAAKLTIEPGAQVKFNGNYYLQIGYSTSKGALYAIGTAGNPIIFTSDKATPAQGDWNYIYFSNATDDALTEMAYCMVEYGGSGSSTGEIRVDSSDPEITNCTIRYSKYDGIRCANASPVIQGGSISDNNAKGIYMSGNSTLTINETYFSGNGSYAISLEAKNEIVTTSGISAAAGEKIEIRTGTIGKDMTWKNLGIPYCISGNITVYKDAATAAKLTIEAGVQVKFNGAYMIDIGSASNKGALYAVGNMGSPIIFTSNLATPQRGDWNFIRFAATTDVALSEMRYCTVEYGGSGASGSIYLTNVDLNISDCTIRYSKYDGIYCSGASPVVQGGSIVDNNRKGIALVGNSVLTINGTSFSGNGTYAISKAVSADIITTTGITGAAGDRVELQSGTISKDTTWRNLGIPYRVTGLITVAKDATTASKLTIEPGTEVRLNGNYGLLIGAGTTNKGALFAVGTAAQPILFSSDNPNPQPGNWSGIRFSRTTDSALTELAYCTFEYGGNSLSNEMYGCLELFLASPRITNCTIRNSKNSGIVCDQGASPTILFCKIYNNKTGIWSQYSEFRVSHCNIYGNTVCGIDNWTASDLVDARYNWWGHASGPSGAGPGSGDAVTTYVAFEPWLGLLYSYPFCIAEGLSSTKQLTTAGGSTWLYGRAEEDSTWAIVIKNSSQQTVKTYGQSGKIIRKSWDGKDSGGAALPAGAYTYQIQAQRQSDLSEATPLVGVINISTDYPVGFISAPPPGDTIAGNISIVGSASDPDFKNYKLEYGNASYPSTWVEIRQSTTPATNGELGSVDFPTLENPIVTFRLTVNDNSSHTTVSLFSCIYSDYGIEVSPDPFSPNGDGKKETTTISAQFGETADWTLNIKDPSGENVIRSFSGSGSSMSQEWNGKNEAGELQNDGLYPFVLSVSTPSMQEPDEVVGNISLDGTLPTVQITDPVEEEIYSNIYGKPYVAEIDGTAADAHFLNYKLEYGETYNPTTWTLIGQYGSPVTSGKLGELDTRALAAGQYTIRLTALDKADNEATAPVHFRVGHLRLSLSAHQLDIGASGTVTVATELPFNVTETVFIKDKAGTTRRMPVSSLPRTSGVYSDVWDGKDDAGAHLPHGEYFVIVTVITQDPVTFTFDLTNTGGVQKPENQDPINSEFHVTWQESFAPYQGQMAQIGFVLDEPYLVDLFAKERLSPGRERNLLERSPLPSSSYTILWDGTDDNGVLLSKSLSGIDNYVVFWAYTLPDNGVIVHGERPEVTALSVSPVYYNPHDKAYPDGLEISYSISKTSDVTISFQNNIGRTVKIMNLGSQTAGPHTVYWDGRAGDGELADSGSYRIGIEATDSIGNTSLIRYCLFVLFY